MDYGWNWITDTIALGGAFQNLNDAIDLAATGITHVLNCTELPDPAYVLDRFLLCWPIPRQADNGAPRTAQWFRGGTLFYRSLPSHAKLYVHCHAGMNRSASMVYAILRMVLNLKRDDARHIIATNRLLDLMGFFGPSILGIRYADEVDQIITNP